MVRIPCNDFKSWQGLNGFDDRAWVRRFAEQSRPGPTCGCIRRVSCRRVTTDPSCTSPVTA